MGAVSFSRAKSPAYTSVMIASSLASQTRSHSPALLDIFQGDSSGEALPVTPFSKPLMWFHAGWSFSLSFWPEGRMLTKWRFSRHRVVWGISETSLPWCWGGQTDTGSVYPPSPPHQISLFWEDVLWGNGFLAPEAFVTPLVLSHTVACRRFQDLPTGAS